jgi:hypothetical protein
VAEFEKATRPEPTDTPGTWLVHLDEQWCIGDKLHGGYLLAVLARAAAFEVTASHPAHDTPQGVTATFLAAPEPGPCEIVVETMRQGRSVSQVRTRLVQGGAPCVEASVVLGSRRPGDPPDVAAPPEEIAPWAECPRSPVERDDGRGRLPIMGVVDTRLDPATTGFIAHRPSGRGRLAGWAAPADGEAWTPTGVLVALDILPPASFDVGLSGWTPTMTFAAAVHATPAPGPVRVVQWVDHLAGDRMVESCRVWDAEGRCVGQATQLAGVRR